MTKQSTTPAKTAHVEDEALPQTAVKPRGKDLLINSLQEQLAKAAGTFESVEQPQDLPIEDEEATFKKRYGDLRRYEQQKDAKYKKELADLHSQLAQLTAASNQTMPKTKEEFEAWKNKYPDIVPFIEMVADEKAASRSSQLQDELLSVKEKLNETEKDKAYATLKSLVPDVEQVVVSAQYKAWLSSQPMFIQDELNISDDPHKIAYYINIYKTATNIPVTKKPNKSDPLASLDVSVRNTGPTPNNSGKAWKFTQSQISKMTTEQFTKLEPEIIEARNSGQILDDVSRRNSVFDL